MHETKDIDETAGEQKKTELITFYNAHKSGVDTADQMSATYNVRRNTRRWSMIIFYAMLNVGGINSMIIHHGNKLEAMPRRFFLKALSHELWIEQLQRRSQIETGLHTSLKMRLKRFVPASDNPATPPLPTKPTKKVQVLWLHCGNRKPASHKLFLCKMQPRNMSFSCKAALPSMLFSVFLWYTSTLDWWRLRLILIRIYVNFML